MQKQSHKLYRLRSIVNCHLVLVEISYTEKFKGFRKKGMK